MSDSNIRIFRHVGNEGPGYLARVLEARGLASELVAIDQGQAVPDDLDGVSGLVFMGGPMSVNDPLPWIEPELDLIRQAVARGMPVLGHCLGGQLISKALGCRVGANAHQEIGWFPVTVRAEAAAQAWVRSVPAEGVELFHWHGETFDIPERAVPLLESRWCANQAYALDNVLAFQCHMEMESDMVSDWARVYAEELSEPGPSVQSPAEMTERLNERIRAMQAVADDFYRLWLDRVENYAAVNVAGALS